VTWPAWRRIQLAAIATGDLRYAVANAVEPAVFTRNGVTIGRMTSIQARLALRPCSEVEIECDDEDA